MTLYSSHCLVSQNLLGREVCLRVARAGLDAVEIVGVVQSSSAGTFQALESVVLSGVLLMRDLHLHQHLCTGNVRCFECRGSASETSIFPSVGQHGATGSPCLHSVLSLDFHPVFCPSSTGGTCGTCYPSSPRRVRGTRPPLDASPTLWGCEPCSTQPRSAWHMRISLVSVPCRAAPIPHSQSQSQPGQAPGELHPPPATQLQGQRPPVPPVAP